MQIRSRDPGRLAPNADASDPTAQEPERGIELENSASVYAPVGGRGGPVGGEDAVLGTSQHHAQCVPTCEEVRAKTKTQELWSLRLLPEGLSPAQPVGGGSRQGEDERLPDSPPRSGKELGPGARICRVEPEGRPAPLSKKGWFALDPVCRDPRGRAKGPAFQRGGQASAGGPRR